MNDLDKDKLLYRPQLRPERDYLSDGEIIYFPLVPPQPIDDDDVIDDTPTKIVDDINEIEELYHILPQDVQHMKESLGKLKKRMIVAFPTGTFTPSEPPDTPQKPTDELPDIINFYGGLVDEGPGIDTVPDLFPQMNNVVLKVEQPKTLVQLIQDGYAKDQIELEKYYTQKLQTIMQRYFQQMMAIMADCGVNSIDDLTKDFDGDFVQIPAGKNLEHLRDFIVRSQVQRNQAARMFHKTHSTDKTLMHMRSWHAANEQRKRYYSEEYKDSSTFTDSHSNSLLRESRASYDNAYNASLYDMYKYLNSSVMITNDILDATLKEAQAKGELLKNGVDIYAVDQSEVEFAKLASNAGQMGDGKGSGFDKEETSTKKDDNNKTQNDSSGKTEQASDEQYENDVKYLLSQGYDKAAADAELSKLAQYKDRLGSSSETGTVKNEVDKLSSSTSGALTSSTTTTAGFWNELAKSVTKNNAIGKIAGAIIEGKPIDEAISTAAKDAIKVIEQESQKILSSSDMGILIPKNETKQKILAAKGDQSKYPEDIRINYDTDDLIAQTQKRVAQIKQDVEDLDAQISKIKEERVESGDDTAKHDELVKASAARSDLLKELASISS